MKSGLTGSKAGSSNTARYKAWEHGILICRVSPAFTSQDCSGCGHRHVARYAEGEAPLEYQPGRPLFLCFTCFKRGNADKNSSVNIGFRFLMRCFEHLSKKPLSKDAGVGSTQAQGINLQIQNGGPNGLALPPVSLAQVRLTGRGYAAETGESVYAGVPEETARLKPCGVSLESFQPFMLATLLLEFIFSTCWM